MLNWFTSKSSGPPFWETYADHFRDTYARRTPLEDLTFVVFDTETTGLDVRKNHLLSLGAVRVKDQRIEVADTLDCIILQPAHQGGEEIAVHGILPKHSQHGVPEAEAVQHFLEFIEDSILVGHHVDFDIAMINQALKKIAGKRLRNKSVDTVQLAMRVNPPSAFVKPGDYALDKLCQLYNLPLEDRHTAAGDAFITALLLLKLLTRLKKRGVRTLGDLLRKKIQ